MITSWQGFSQLFIKYYVKTMFLGSELQQCNSRVCQYAKGFLIRWSSSGIVGALILRYLPFLFFQISFIFRFFLNPHLAPNLYIVVQLVLHLDYWWQQKWSKHIGPFIFYTIENKSKSSAFIQDDFVIEKTYI